ncbi:MAG: hypothetical protein F6K11_28220 [Leptolyngbya sp. SIO3F4]|nr:hypothetical protein [Leptolyngbya sp. SIO3F4]
MSEEPKSKAAKRGNLDKLLQKSQEVERKFSRDVTSEPKASTEVQETASKVKRVDMDYGNLEFEDFFRKDSNAFKGEERHQAILFGDNKNELKLIAMALDSNITTILNNMVLDWRQKYADEIKKTKKRLTR